MDPKRFQNSTAGRVVRFGQGETAYWAFLPNPLPPLLAFDAELVQALSEADRALGELSGAGRTMPNPNLLIRPFISREAVLSSRIEGTQAEIDDLYAYQLSLFSYSEGLALNKADVHEVDNYVRALEYGLKRLKTLPVSLRLIRELHERLLKGVRGEQATPGEFRRTQNWIGRPGCTLNEATFVPPPVPEMQAALETLEKYLHLQEAYPPLVRLAFIHYQFEAIHPFIDGNGRIGRLLVSLLLLDWDLLALPLLYLSAYFEHRRDEYYDRLLAVSTTGDWNGWVLFFLRGVAEQARDAAVRAKTLQDLQTKWRRQLQTARATSLMQGIADWLFEQPILSAVDVQKKFKVTHPTAITALRRLEKMKILKERPGRERSRLYVAGAILKVVE
jgi:Fic family protein